MEPLFDQEDMKMIHAGLDHLRDKIQSKGVDSMLEELMSAAKSSGLNSSLKEKFDEARKASDKAQHRILKKLTMLQATLYQHEDVLVKPEEPAGPDLSQDAPAS